LLISIGAVRSKFKKTNYIYDLSRLQELNDIAPTPPRGFSAT